MTSPQFQAALLGVCSLLLVSIACGMLAAWFWAGARVLGGQPPLPAEPFAFPRTVVWKPVTMLVLVLLYYNAQAAAVVGYQRVVGVDLGAIAARMRAESEPLGAGPDAEKARLGARDAMHLMACNATFNILFLAAFPGVFLVASRGRLEDLGLTRSRWHEQVEVGVVAGLLVTPLIYVIHALALKAFPPRLHPVQVMLGVDFDPLMAGISVLGAVILAPVFEEILFRGVLQGWLTHMFRRAPNPLDDGAASSPPFDDADWASILLTSAVFAGLHAAQWPTPIPLFGLALALGWLKRKTGSLLSPIVVHALFNAVSTLAMLAAQADRGPAPPQPAPAPVGRSTAADTPPTAIVPEPPATPLPEGFM